MTTILRTLCCAAAVIALFLLSPVARAQTKSAQSPANASKTLVWHTVEFAIVRFNDNEPNSWNIYHGEKKGIFLIRLWKRYLLVYADDQEAYDIDPQKIKVNGTDVTWSAEDVPDKPIDTPDFTSRNVGTMERIRFRLGKDGHFLELQIPLGPTGRPLY
jgi:hypothetical protein